MTMCAKIYRKLDITKPKYKNGPTGRDLIMRELQMVAELDHPNIYKIHESFEDTYKIYFIIDDF